MPKLIVKIIAALMIVGLVVASGAGIAKAEPAECGDSYLAVGGYPPVERVPEGYTPVYTPGGIFPWDNKGFNHGQAVGAANVIDAVDTFAEACPEGEIHLSGYSYGAAIVHTAVEHIDSQPYAPRVHVELRGNPRHAGGVEDMFAGSTVFPGITFRGAGAIPENVATFEDRCNKRDGICNLPRLLADPVGHVAGSVGYLTGAHRY